VHFAHPWFLLALLVLPVLAVLAYRQKGSAGLLFSHTADATAAPPSVWARLAWLPGACVLGALGLGIVALARPQDRDVTVERSAEGIDIALVLDISTSMKNRDFGDSRFESAKRVAAEFIDGRVSDRIGLVVFAAQAYTQAPLTLDYRFLKQMLAEVEMGRIEDGTAIGTALATATARLQDADAESRVVILLTDGQNNRGEIDPATAAEVAQTMGVRVYVIGVGAEMGGRARGSFGGLLSGRAPELDETVLQSVAETTGGRYFRATDEAALRAIYAEISALERTPVEERQYVDVEERYGPWAAGALGLLALGTLLQTTRLRRVP
jgi:Ca-activated chloride channel family protein